MIRHTDILVIGSGVAALQLAHHISRDMNVIILTKSTLSNGNSSLAQGGIAAALDDKDQTFYHFIDTILAGRLINDHRAALMMTQEAPSLIRNLADQGCTFDYDSNHCLSLGNEGAHTHSRIVHGGGDQTGKVITNYLQTNLPDHVQIRENHFVFEILTNAQGRCYGVKSKDEEGDVHEFHAPHTVLATGGCGQLYASSSNAPTVTGDGIALAYLAGAELADMEFIQFHPTLLSLNEGPRGLISEAVRGEGAILIDSKGERIMETVHPLKELAPRHIVSQTIHQQRKKGREVFLDVRPIQNFQTKFPTVTKLCESNKVDVDLGFIPVSPGCHFSMGGVKTDRTGRTTIEGLYAVGEVACTGVHGANRLASNSLLEGLVFGRRLAKHLNLAPLDTVIPSGTITRRPPFSFPLPPKKEIQKRMMESVGIVRNGEQLMDQLLWLESFQIHEWNHYDFSLLTFEQMTRVLMLQTAWSITKSALEREESRGGHYRSDFPREEPVWLNKQTIRKKTIEMGRTNEPIQT
ncbi:L-aspartate oxidase [Halobacillus karajensis]|uniref:L-aspartate oxidase n=1 Tax=Halobacillus karajensis TaxID=195088 RepID=A0A024P8F4_9BACI|nr:L-aspartate oxidase [Halobacillus karajensis]CDQ21469.1 L-aspartate oxidase [Halobacillus karajensis]CDQ25404.1 L-aspartate oxidase [Halobacillus karajensis]CDQ29728.1 L-aspartate oxidase [Halobacillus karajensis]SEI07989.1 L-aspartate oxidase [Halobacillus karajensis]